MPKIHPWNNEGGRWSWEKLRNMPLDERQLFRQRYANLCALWARGKLNKQQFEELRQIRPAIKRLEVITQSEKQP